VEIVVQRIDLDLLEFADRDGTWDGPDGIIGIKPASLRGPTDEAERSQSNGQKT
jgi:hypothetical protein